MEVSIEQTLQQGVAAHKEGKLQEAERLYRAILQSKPAHPDANHNLGVIAVSVNKVDAALPLFKTALETNPTIEQFWLSYIDALIREKQFDNALQVLEQAKRQGVDGNRLNPLESRIQYKTEKTDTARVSPPKELLNSLLVHYQSGRFGQAEKLAISMTQEFPKHEFAWKVLGALLGATGRSSEAVDVNETAVALSPHDAEAYSILGVTLQELGRLDEAEASYRQAIALKPDFAEAHNNLGNTHKELRRLDEAEASYRQAIALKPDFAQAHNNLGVTLKELGRLEEAEVIYRQAIALNPDFAEAHNNLGNTHKELRRLDEAEASYRQAIALKPDFAEAHNNLGVTLQELGRLDEAESSLRQVIALKPDFAEAHNNLGNTLQELGRLDEAEASYRQAIALKSDYANAHYNLGNTLKELERLDEAEANYRQAIVLKPDFAEAHNNLGNTLKKLGRLDKAEATYRQAIALKPDFAEAHSNLLMLLGSMLFNKDRYHADATDFARVVDQTVTSRFDTWSHSRAEESIRIGFVSGDLRSHPVGYFLENLLIELQSSSIELFAYPTVNTVDAVTSRLKPLFDMWCPLVGLNDMEAAQKIHGDGIHILIDLAGHTAKNRLPVFAWKPAPIQVSWLGYFASTGLPEMDYILGDPYVTPHTEADHFVEKIWQLPESYFCFSPPEFDLDVGSLPAYSNGFITFGCLNQISKMTAAVVSVRARLLHAVPGSKLLLKNKGIDIEPNRSRILSMFSEVGIHPWRLILEGESTREEHLACYQRIDIALSPFPYNGGTTSVEGLWMGVPVITMRGDHFVSHVSESIAHNAGLAEWVAADEDEYIAKGLAFASDLNALSILRKRLREKVLRQSLFDAERFACHFGEAVLAMRKILARSER